MLLTTLLAASLMGPPAPPAPDQTRPAATVEQRLDVLEGTLGDFAFLAAGGLVDVFGTEWALHRRPGVFREAGGLGLAFNGTARVVGKTAATLVLTWACHELRKDGHPKAAKLLSRIGGGAWAGLGAVNIAQAR